MLPSETNKAAQNHPSPRVKRFCSGLKSPSARLLCEGLDYCAGGNDVQAPGCQNPPKLVRSLAQTSPEGFLRALACIVSSSARRLPFLLPSHSTLKLQFHGRRNTSGLDARTSRVARQRLRAVNLDGGVSGLAWPNTQRIFDPVSTSGDYSGAAINLT